MFASLGIKRLIAPCTLLEIGIIFSMTIFHTEQIILLQDWIIGDSLSEPHIDELNVRNPNIHILCTLDQLDCHPRAAIDITLACAIYSD